MDQIIALAVEVEGVMLVVVYVFLHIDLVVDKYNVRMYFISLVLLFIKKRQYRSGAEGERP